MTTRTADHTPSPSDRVVDAVAAERGVDPTTLSPPLGTVIDPEALDRLVGHGGDAETVVSFQYAGFLVTVRSGDLSLEPLSEA